VVRRAGLVILFVAACGANVQGQQLDRYYYVDPVVLPDSLVERYDGERFSITVLRHARSDLERALLSRAESLYPSAAQIEEDVHGFLNRLEAEGAWPEAFRQASEFPGPRWWWREWDDVRLPYALTGAAVIHYIERVRYLSGAPNPMERYEPGVKHSASFRYEAWVEAENSGGYSVHLTARWSFRCGSACALWFSHSREVRFAADGTAQSVTGDGPPNYEVS